MEILFKNIMQRQKECAQRGKPKAVLVVVTSGVMFFLALENEACVGLKG